VFNATGVGVAQTITFDEITKTGQATPATFTTAASTTGTGNLTYTNSSTTNSKFLILDVYASGGATVTLNPPSASSVVLGVLGGDRNRSLSVFVPAQGTVTVTGTGVTYRYTTQEV